MCFVHLSQFRPELDKLRHIAAKKPPRTGFFAKKAEQAEPSFDDTKTAFMADLHTFLDGKHLDTLTLEASKKYGDNVAEITRWETADMSRGNCVRILVVIVIGSNIGDDPYISNDEIVAKVASLVPDVFVFNSHIDALMAAIHEIIQTSGKSMIARGWTAAPFFEHVDTVLEIIQRETTDDGLVTSIQHLSELGNALFGGTVFR